MIFNKAALLLLLSVTGVIAEAQNFGGSPNAVDRKAKSTTKTTSTAAATSAASSAAAASSSSSGSKAASGSGSGSLTLDASVIQSASASIGNVNVTAGEANSETSTDNFINTCAGKTLTNGLQTTSGSCNGIPMGDIPSTSNMVSTIITNPQTGVDIAANTDFTFTAQTVNLQAGSFTNAKSTYYSAPQRLASSGKIIGHLHFTCQKLSGLNPTQPPDANTFAFFKGVDDAGVNGLLSATVTGGLPAGTYRVCTMSSASNHQPVVMPIAQRGAQDDCTKFTVGGSGTASNAAGSAAAASAASSSTAKAASTKTTSAATKATSKASKSRFGGKVRFAKRDFIA